jgi:hypothetical protein
MNIEHKEEHSRIIRDHRKTFKRLAKQWLADGTIVRDQYEEIVASVSAKSWRIADTYGAEIEVNGERAKFFYYAQLSAPLKAKVEVGGTNPREIIVADFTRWDVSSRKQVASLIVAIDSDKYLATIKNLGVRQQDILEPFVGS